MQVKKLLFSLGIVTAVGASAFAGTQALLSDDAVLADNSFSTGTVSLLVNTGLSGNPENFGNDVPGFSDTLFPGETVENFIRLRNDNSGVDLSIAAQANVNSGASTIPANQVTVAFTPVDETGEPLVDAVTVSKTLDLWETTVTELGDPVIATNTTQRYLMEVTVNENFEGDNATTIFDFVFTGTQVLED